MDEYPKSLYHADKIYIVLAASIIYYIYKYKHLHVASYKYLGNFKSTHPNQCHNWTSWKKISSNFGNQNTRRNIPVRDISHSVN